MNYPDDKKELDDFYKEWYEANKDRLGDTWNRTDVYDFASKYAEKRLFLANVVGRSEQLVCPKCAFWSYSKAPMPSFSEKKWAYECNKCCHYWESN